MSSTTNPSPNFHQAIMASLTEVYKERKQEIPFSKGIVEPKTGHIGYMIRKTNEHSLLFFVESDCFSFLLSTKEDSYTAKCIQSNQTSTLVAQELVSFFSRLQKEDTSGNILCKLHMSLMSFRWTHRNVK